jgi:hypothetical protein
MKTIIKSTLTAIALVASLGVAGAAAQAEASDDVQVVLTSTLITNCDNVLQINDGKIYGPTKMVINAGKQLYHCFGYIQAVRDYMQMQDSNICFGLASDENMARVLLRAYSPATSSPVAVAFVRQTFAHAYQCTGKS